MRTGVIKWLEGIFPATLAKAVYVNGTNKTIQDYMDDGTIVTYSEMRKILERVAGTDIDNLVAYKGDFDWNAYSSSAAFRAEAVKGDYWTYTGEGMQNVDYHTLMPNGIVWFDGETFQVMYVPYQNDTKPKPHYDVVIVGSGAGGIGAAYALRNSGWRVALIERLDTLGGTHCQGVGLYIPSPICPWYKPIVKGFHDMGVMGFTPRYQKPLYGVGPGTNFDKAYRCTQYTSPEASAPIYNDFQGNFTTNCDYKLSQKYYADLKDSMDIFINTELKLTNSKNGAVYSIITKNVLTGVEYEICGDYFLDCSGDGVLYTSDPNLALDTDYFIGADPADRFGEIGAGLYPTGYAGDHNGINTVEPMWFRAYRQYGKPGMKWPDAPTQFRQFSDVVYRANFEYWPLTDGSSISSMSQSYGAGMEADKFVERSNVYNWGEGYDRALALVYQTGTYTAGSRFAGIRRLLAIREKFRVNSERNLSAIWLQTAISSANYAAEHIIALSTWYPDIHTKTQNYNPDYTIPNGVPYESMIPVAYQNVLVACKAAGFSHLSMSSMRLVKTIMDMGHSAGVAILQLLNSNTRGDVRTVDVAQLQADIQIADTIAELEQYFLVPTVEYEELTVTNGQVE